MMNTAIGARNPHVDSSKMEIQKKPGRLTVSIKLSASDCKFAHEPVAATSIGPRNAGSERKTCAAKLIKNN